MRSSHQCEYFKASNMHLGQRNVMITWLFNNSRVNAQGVYNYYSKAAGSEGP